jgi:hypothetical protein
MEKTPKDQFGRPIAVGDYIVYCPDDLQFGKVLGIETKKQRYSTHEVSCLRVIGIKKQWLVDSSQFKLNLKPGVIYWPDRVALLPKDYFPEEIKTLLDSFDETRC